MRSGSGLRVRSWGDTNPGLRRSVNEDNLLVDDRRRLWAVADGMGGHAAGDEASATIMRALGYVRAGWPTARALANDVIDRIEDADRLIKAETARLDRGQAGSTVCCLAAFGQHALIAWCGDSRVYRRRAGRPAPLERLTRDHTVVQELVDEGRLAEADAESHPQAHVLTRAVGAMDRLELDYRQIDIQRGERYLLCSDGLSRVVPEAEIEAALTRHKDVRAGVAALIDAALAAGAPDNVTVVLVDFD
jgi:serine/threonine protein phosphatase PrpC